MKTLWYKTRIQGIWFMRKVDHCQNQKIRHFNNAITNKVGLNYNYDHNYNYNDDHQNQYNQWNHCTHRQSAEQHKSTLSHRSQLLNAIDYNRIMPRLYYDYAKIIPRLY